METRRELKQEVKGLFRGRWRAAILMAIIPTLMTIISVMNETRSERTNMMNNTETVNHAANTIGNQPIVPWVTGILIGGLVASLIAFIINLLRNMFVVSSQYSFLEWLRNPERKNHVVRDATSTFSSEYGWPIVALTFLTSLYVALWTLLFIVPGIIKFYAYSQSFLVYKDMLAETPAGQPRPKFNDAITKSRQLMSGHKMQYFVLQLSFIGWIILAVITLGIGFLWLTPYQYATNMNYYIHLTAHDRQANGVNSMVA